MKSSILFTLLAMSAWTASSDFAKYIELTVAYSGTSVSNFPALVRLDSSRIDYADVKNAGADLQFTDAAGETIYPHEIDTWNPSDESLVWVRLPQLAAGTKFRMYYGDASVATNATRADVWRGYDLVCHVGANADDSTENAHAGLLNPDGIARNDGKVGKAYGMPVTDKGAAIIHQLYEGNAAGALDDTEFSYSFWVRRTGALATWNPFVGPRNGSNADAWGIGSTSSTDGSSLYLWATQSSKSSLSVSGGLTENQWRKIDVAQNASGLVLYVDGQQAGSLSLAAPHRCWVAWMAWGGSCGNASFSTSSGSSVPADFDECRIFSSAADAARIAADYATVADAGFLTYAAPRDNVGEPGSALVLH